ncbi:universal stress protein [Sphingomonas qomolangmaensis]|uniref:Universal stress protein n=1 Tax=Sphingomonas qomolangmaensis TaxID=2918765 RepID=A0ABY5L813_9SPHN|nr:universal stress protein [Sphingomonas qomolangmaensis]UUL83110.1 universal stress protein [Sphingomonas qomolangmaensis]
MTLQNILACIDASSYANAVCDLAAWAAKRLEMPVELLHVVQRKDAASSALAGAIGPGAKTDLVAELAQLDAADARFQGERSEILLQAGEARLRESGIAEVRALHRQGGIVETILEQEADARIVVIGKRGASHEFAIDHVGSKIERVVRASNKPILIASRTAGPPERIVFAYDASPAADRALERLVNSPLLAGLPVHIVMADSEHVGHRIALKSATAQLSVGHAMTTTLQKGKPEQVIADIVAATPGAMLMMGAYGHSRLRSLIVGSTTTTMIRTVRTPVLLIR